MTIPIKTDKKIKTMARAGKKLAYVMAELISFSQVGTNLLEIEDLACKLIAKQGGEPGFKKVPGYSWATCININDGIVHGVPFDYKIQNGDVLSIDSGIFLDGLHTDMCRTFAVGKSNKKIDEFLRAGRIALQKATQAAKAGSRVGDISLAIWKTVEKEAGYTCSRSLTGHGVGENLHEPPNIPCFLKQPIPGTIELKQGMTLAIEVIYSLGRPDLVVDKDGWTIKMKDGKMSAVFENTVAVLKNGPKVLTSTG
jgi:methionyl aminopeptidase